MHFKVRLCLLNRPQVHLTKGNLPMDTSDIGTSNLFQQLDNYSWNTDEEFQIGLASILGQNPSEEQAEDLTLKAKCFYYARYSPQDFSFA